MLLFQFTEKARVKTGIVWSVGSCNEKFEGMRMTPTKIVPSVNPEK